MYPIPYLAALYLAVIQFFFATTWVVYVVFLPGLLKKAGIDASWLIWLLLLDQLVFTITDTAMGYAADKIERLIGRLGPMIVWISVITCVAFALLPLVVGREGQAHGKEALLALIFIWVITSSVLRAPPLVLLTKYAAKPQVPCLASLSLLGLALAGAAAPYLQLVMKGMDARFPFLLTSGTLFATVLGLVWVERQLQPPSVTPALPISPEPYKKYRTIIYLLMLGTLCIGIGFQLHYFLNSSPLIKRFLPLATTETLAWLLPVFWIGFKILMLVGTPLVRRIGGIPVVAIAAGLGAVGVIAANLAPNIYFLMVAQFITGGAWGCLFSSGISTALGLGKTGHEGLVLGGWFSMLSLATLGRMGMVATEMNKLPAIAGGLPSIAALFWIIGALLLLTATLLYRRTERLYSGSC